MSALLQELEILKPTSALASVPDQLIQVPRPFGKNEKLPFKMARLAATDDGRSSKPCPRMACPNG